MTSPADGPRLAALDVDALDALAVPDVTRASALVGVRVPVEIGDESWLWAMRREQVRLSPADLPWVAHLLVVDGEAVGHAGFHGAPDEDGAVELGYWIAPPRRRRGHGATALRLLEEWGRTDPRVRTLRASVAPANDASTRLVLRAGYARVREVWDDEDGLEVMHELDVTG